MMKKVLSVVLVLTMASMASAGFVPTLDIQVNGAPWDGQSSVIGSDNVKLTFVDMGDTTAPGPFNLFVMSVDHGDASSFTYFLPNGLLGGSLALDSPVGDGFSVGGGALYGPTAQIPVDRALYTVDFHVPLDLQDSTQININFSGAYGGIDVSSLNTALHVVPEPMTIALLGLGSLFLRHRRK